MAQAVLPSNAPPLRDEQATRAALQEHSANRQQIYHHHHHHYPTLTGYEQHKLSAQPAVHSENAYAVRAPVGSVYYPSQPTYYRQSYHQRHADTDREGQLRVEKQWRTLYERFLQCPKYKDYRERQHKDGKSGQDHKWPERLEQAFFKALLYWPPMGRRKHMHKEKQRGRNELIADYINELTGVPRSRKQVSSHIQVLKQLVVEDKQIMRWMSDNQENEHTGDSARRFGGYHPPYTIGRMRSTYTAGAQPMHSEHGTEYRVPTREAVRLAKPQLDVFEPFEFKLFVQPSGDPEKRGIEENEPLHTYSTSTRQPMQADEHIPDWTALQQQYPLLAGMHAIRPIDCNVLAVEASLAMPTKPWRDSKNIELAVILNCMSRQLLQNCKIRCVNRFFKDGQALHSTDGSGSGDVQLTMSETGDRAETHLKFGSNFWAITLNPTSTLAKSIMASAQAEPSERAKIRRGVDSDMQSITAIQEISVPTLTGAETVLIMHWSFRLSNGECGNTTWRRLHIPAATSQATPIKSEMSGAVAVDTPFDFNAPIDVVAVCSAGAQQSYPAPLQSPFAYDSGSASATSPTTTWPTTVSTVGSQVHNMNMDQSLDFSQQNLMFDSSMGYDGFDTSTFNFDADANYDFTTDPNSVDVQLYAQKWANAPTATNYAADGFDAKQQWPDYSTQAAYASYPQAAANQQPETYPAYGTQKVYEEQLYNTAVPNDGQQAFPGAVMKDQLPVESWSSGRC